MPQVIVVTGAGAGVGRAVAREFAKRGDTVGLIGRDAERLKAAAAELQTFGVRAGACPADVAAANAIESDLWPHRHKGQQRDGDRVFAC